MKPEKEIKWLVFLYNSPYVKDILNFKINQSIGCKRDFEIVVGSSENSREFNEWFRKLIIFGVFEFIKTIKRGFRNNYPTDGYTVNTKKLVEYAKLNPLYKDTYKFFNRDRII